MPFNAITQPASGGGPVRKAGIDACLTHARASAAAGDVYQDSSTDACYVYDASGSGILIPSKYAGKTLTLLSNASGGAYVTSSDALSDVTGRGWVVLDNIGTTTKTAGSSLVCDSSGASSYAQIRFTPSSAPASTASVLCIAKIGVSAASDFRGCLVRVGDGTRLREVKLNKGSTPAPGEWCYFNSGSQAELSTYADLDTGLTEAWVSMYFGGSGDLSVCELLTDREKFCVATYTDFWALASSIANVIASTDAGKTTTISVAEMFWLEVS